MPIHLDKLTVKISDLDSILFNEILQLEKELSNE